MSTATALNFQDVIPQNDARNLCHEGGDDPEKDPLLRRILLSFPG